MVSRRRIPRRESWADFARLVTLLVVAVACATPDAARIDIDPPADPRVHGRDRVLVAGFVAESVRDRRGSIDVNQETTRLLRSELRSKASLQVIEAEPLHLERVESRPVLEDTSFWRRIGEEYGEPLIVTGTVEFKSAGSRYEERMAGRRVRRIWLPGFSLSGTVMLIDGRTGQLVDSLPLQRLIAYATTTGEPALAIYFRLMNRTMPSILTLLGHKAAHQRVLLR